MYHIEILNKKEAAIYTDTGKLDCILPIEEAETACRLKNEWEYNNLTKEAEIENP